MHRSTREQRCGRSRTKLRNILEENKKLRKEGLLDIIVYKFFLLHILYFFSVIQNKRFIIVVRVVQHK